MGAAPRRAVPRRAVPRHISPSACAGRVPGAASRDVAPARLAHGEGPPPPARLCSPARGLLRPGSGPEPGGLPASRARRLELASRAALTTLNTINNFFLPFCSYIYICAGGENKCEGQSMAPIAAVRPCAALQQRSTARHGTIVPCGAEYGAQSPRPRAKRMRARRARSRRGLRPRYLRVGGARPSRSGTRLRPRLQRPSQARRARRAPRPLHRARRGGPATSAGRAARRSPRARRSARRDSRAAGGRVRRRGAPPRGAARPLGARMPARGA